MADDTPAAELAQFLCDLSIGSIPDTAIPVVERCFVDSVGVGLAGTRSPAGEIALDVVETVAGEAGNARLLGRSTKAPVTGAAFANGVAIHALDFDDDQFELTSHPSATMVPAILAVGESIGASGRDAIRAYVAGFETQYYLSRAITPSHYERGWHATATFGTFGATAAVASLLGLDAEKTRHALNAAASLPAGTKANFGSMVKPMHAGTAARSGVTVGLLAERSFTASRDAIAGTNGFFDLYADDERARSDQFPTLGERWAIVEDGVYVKKYPCCYATHAAIEAAIAIAKELDVAPDDVASIKVTASEGAADMLGYPDPETSTEAMFSMVHVVACAIRDRSVGLDSFEPSAVDDPAVKALRESVTVTVDDDLAYTDTTATVTVETRDGTVVQRRRGTAPGSPTDPLPETVIRDKFFECVSRAIDETTAQSLYRLLSDLRALDNLETISSVLSE